MATNYMQAHFEAVLVEYGHNIWLQRTLKTGDDNYDNYGNIGYSSTLEKYTVRYTVSDRQLLGRQQEEMEGVLSTSERIYYFQKDAHPFDGDRIYEYDEVAKMKTVWSIDTSVPMRGVSGEIIFYTASATRIIIN